MFPMEHDRLRDPQGCGLMDGFGAGTLSFLDQTAPDCLGFLNHC